MSVSVYEVRTNLPDFRRQMDELGPKVGRRVLRFAVAGAARVFRDVARARAPMRQASARGGKVFASRYGNRMPGLLRRSIIVVRNRRESGRTTETYTSTVRTGDPPTKGGASRDAYYWRWVEAGHVKRQPGGRLTGGARTRSAARAALRRGGEFVEGRWYMRSAFAQAGNRALAEFYRRAEAKFRETKL